MVRTVRIDPLSRRSTLMMRCSVPFRTVHPSVVDSPLRAGEAVREGSADEEDAASGDEGDAEALAAALAFSRAQARAAERP